MSSLQTLAGRAGTTGEGVAVEPLVPWQTAEEATAFRMRTRSDVGDDFLAETPRRDQYDTPTFVQPKTPYNDSAQDAAEHVFRVFHKGCGLGIRSLPNALHPAFRQHLFQQLMTQRDALLDGRATRTSPAATAAASGRDVSPGRQHGRSCHSSPPSAVHARANNPTAAALAAAAAMPRPTTSVDTGAAAATAERLARLPPMLSPSRTNPYAGCFGHIEHLNDEFDRAHMFEVMRQQTSKQAQCGDDPFVYRGCPLPFYHQGVFSSYTYGTTPYMVVDWLGRSLYGSRDVPRTAQPSSKAADAAGPSASSSSSSSSRAFMPPGRARVPNVSDELRLKGSCPDLLVLLKRRMRKDWPQSFLQAFTNQAGSIVLSFDGTAAAQEGDVAAYMNKFIKADGLAVEFRLSKDPLQWGASEASGGPLFFVMRPAWAHHKPDVPEQLAGAIPVWTQAPHTISPSRCYSRDPFANLSASGGAKHFHARLLQRAGAKATASGFLGPNSQRVFLDV